ncbi:pre-rRNA-processing protein TSR2-like [Corylus avellana]|uniref:pre-rRNA-processing protein TSR2-like n=1 Tax=Corylus avellana TaxID=13451 RepID=UPI00286A8220|nr:pre-rRNA-processing protein TSR2-like [Corylus avellana]XP_059437343.1 pre-rRNA-processing protein TSR2-like [Corylus avellana]
MDVDRPRELSAEALGVLREGIHLVLSRWWALQMAAQNEWGGPHSGQVADQLAYDIASWFTQSREPLYIDDLEHMLQQALESLNTLAEDGSVEEVAEKLMIMHEECLEGNFKSIESLRKVSVPHVRQVVNDDDADSDNDVSGNDANKNDDLSNMMPDDSSNMALDAPELLSNSSYIDMPVNEPRPKLATEAEDGWVQVGRRRNRGKRN